MSVEVNPWTGQVLVYRCEAKNVKQLIARIDDLRQYHLWLVKEHDDGTIQFEEDQ